jgi:hypothetical protein
VRWEERPRDGGEERQTRATSNSMDIKEGKGVKILAIMGSPHKGNSLEFTQRIEEKLQQLGDVDFEYVHLKDVDLEPCKGCFTCFIKGEDRCPPRTTERRLLRRSRRQTG